jgi:histidinol-phosphatase (PHP family)
MSEPILYETHLHTPLCKHAEGEPEDYAAAAAARGLKGIIVTCHNPMPGDYSSGVRMAENQFAQYCAMVDRARCAWRGRIDVRLGMECDFSPGFETYLHDQLTWADFHYILGSVHPQITEYREKYDTNGPVAYQNTYFEHLALAAETKLFDCLSHPDLIKNFTAAAWDLPSLIPHISRCLDRIASAGTAMELNTSGLNKTIREMNPAPAILRLMRQRHIPVVIGSDAHEPARVADHFADALDLLESCGYEQVSFFLDRRRRDVPIETARQSLTCASEPR